MKIWYGVVGLVVVVAGAWFITHQGGDSAGLLNDSESAEVVAPTLTPPPTTSTASVSPAASTSSTPPVEHSASEEDAEAQAGTQEEHVVAPGTANTGTPSASGTNAGAAEQAGQ